MTSLIKTGVPGPDLARTEALSNSHGGYHIKRIQLASSILELDDILMAAKKIIRPSHIGMAALKLGDLSQLSSIRPPPPLATTTSQVTPPSSIATPYKSSTTNQLFQRQRISAQLERLASQWATRMVTSNIASVLQGLLRANHQLTHLSLQKLAARIIANDCQRLSVASSWELKAVVQGFSSHGYLQPVFWERVSQEILRRMSSSLEPARLASILLYLPKDLLHSSPIHQGSLQVLTRGSKQLDGKALLTLNPGLGVDLLNWASRIHHPSDSRKAPLGGEEEKEVISYEVKHELSNAVEPLVKALIQAGPQWVPRLKPESVASLASSAARVLSSSRRSVVAGASLSSYEEDGLNLCTALTNWSEEDKDALMGLESKHSGIVLAAVARIRKLLNQTAAPAA